MKSPVRCFWHHEGKLHQTNVTLDPDAALPFETYEEVLTFVKDNLSVADNVRKFAVMSIVE